MMDTAAKPLVKGMEALHQRLLAAVKDQKPPRRRYEPVVVALGGVAMHRRTHRGKPIASKAVQMQRGLPYAVWKAAMRAERLPADYLREGGPVQ